MENALEIFDYIIVGAGSAGCVLANRLSENPNTSVLLIEAGPPDHHPFIHMPKGIAKIMGNTGFTWAFTTEPEDCNANTAEYWARGRTLGGSSAINGMMYVRGQPADYDGMAEQTSDDECTNGSPFSRVKTASPRAGATSTDLLKARKPFIGLSFTKPIE